MQGIGPDRYHRSCFSCCCWWRIHSLSPRTSERSHGMEARLLACRASSTRSLWCWLRVAGRPASWESVKGTGTSSRSRTSWRSRCSWSRHSAGCCCCWLRGAWQTAAAAAARPSQVAVRATPASRVFSECRRRRSSRSSRGRSPRNGC